MRTRIFRRGGAAALFLAAISAALFGFSTAAQASVILYEAQNVNVTVTNGEAIAFKECIGGAQDKTVQNIGACRKVASAGEILLLENVYVYVYSASAPFSLLYTGFDVNVELTGGAAAAGIRCVNDAQDGYIYEFDACQQSPLSGPRNAVWMFDVNVVVTDISD